MRVFSWLRLNAIDCRRQHWQIAYFIDEKTKTYSGLLQGCVYFSIPIFDHDDDNDDSRRISRSVNTYSRPARQTAVRVYKSRHIKLHSLLCAPLKTIYDCDSEATERIRRLYTFLFLHRLFRCLLNLILKTDSWFIVAIIKNNYDFWHEDLFNF
jgi:hypothetical protein